MRGTSLYQGVTHISLLGVSSGHQLKMFLKEIILACVLITFAVAKVPPYIKLCGRRNPNIDKCIMESVQSLRGKLSEGIAELDVPPIDPFEIDYLKLVDMPNFNANVQNVTISGFSNFKLSFLHHDFDKQMIEIHCNFDSVKIIGTYDVSAKILVPIVGRGPITINTKNYYSKGKISFKYTERGGKKYLYFSSMAISIKIEDYDIEMGSDSGNKALHEAINQVLGSSHQEIIEAAKPTIEKNIAERVLILSNNICKHFTFDELFPDTE